MTRVNSQDELAAISSLPEAIIYLWVEWSMQARQSDPVVGRFQEALQRKHGAAALPFYCLDVSDQSGDLWEATRKWFGDRLTYSGYGALVWIRQGRTVQSAVWAAAHTVEELLEMTERAFAKS